jgi:hypothetical protein
VTPPTCVAADIVTDIAQFHAFEVVLLGGPGALGAGVESLTSC